MRMVGVCSLPGGIYRFERFEASSGESRSGRPDRSAGYPERRSEVDRVEVQAQTCDQIVPIGEDLGPSTVQKPPIGENPGHSEFLDEGVAVDADHPGSELDSFHMSEHPVEPTLYAGVPVKANTKQLHGAILGEARHDPVEVACLECLVELSGGLTD